MTSKSGNHQRQGILFNSAGATSSGGGSELGPIRDSNYGNGGGSLNLSGNDCPSGMLFSSQTSLDSSLTHSSPGMKHDTGFAAEWSIDEHNKLEQGLAKYAHEPNIAKYIKIAASLPDKTVRDVALRCRWLTSKRRKQEHLSLRQPVKDQKEKVAGSAFVTAAPSMNVAPYSSTTNQHNRSDSKLLGALGGAARHLLEENTLAFEQILVNLSSLKLQQNIDLFFRTRNNLIAILNGMKNMPGIMSQMPPLPVLLNEELASTIFPLSSQSMMFSSSTTTPVKQEPGC